MMQWILVFGLFLLTGCINITASLQPEQADVRALRMGSDCAPIILGFGFGRVSLDGALNDADAFTLDTFRGSPQKITKVRRVQLHDHLLLGFGARCIEVIGE